MSQFISVRKWTLKDGASEEALLSLVRDAVVPAYRLRPGCLKLALVRLQESRSFLAITYWADRRAAATRAPEGWEQSYARVLEQWDRLMTFEEEWTGEDMLSS